MASTLRYFVSLAKFNLYNEVKGTDWSDNLRISTIDQTKLRFTVFFSDKEKKHIGASFFVTNFEQLVETFLENSLKTEGAFKYGMRQNSTWEGEDHMSSLTIGRSKNGVCYLRLLVDGIASPAFKFTKYKNKDITVDGEPIDDEEASRLLMRNYLKSLISTTEAVAAEVAVKEAHTQANDNKFSSAGKGDSDGKSNYVEDDIPF